MTGGDRYDVFISYSTKDRLIAEALAERLAQEGVRFWKAPESIAAGTHYSEAIARDIPKCSVMLVLLSDKSNTSHHVERELLCALDECKPILPVRIEDVQPSTKLRYALTGAQRVDAFPPFRQHLDRITASLVGRLEALRRDAPVVRVREPADGFSAVRGAPLKVCFEILLGHERRLKRARMEIRRDGALLLHRRLADSEMNDRGGRHEVEWLLPEALADGGHFQLAVLVSDTEGQEGSAQMAGSFAVRAADTAAVAEPAPAAERESPAPVVSMPVVEPEPEPEPEPVRVAAAAVASVAETKPQPVPEKMESAKPPRPKPAGIPTKGDRVVGAAFDIVFSLGAWSFRLVWMLALAGVIAGAAHGWLEPYTATRETVAMPFPYPFPNPIPTPRPDPNIFPRPPAHGAANSIVYPEKNKTPESVPLNPSHSALSSELRRNPTGAFHGPTSSALNPQTAPASGTTPPPSSVPTHGALLSEANPRTPVPAHTALSSALRPATQPASPPPAVDNAVPQHTAGKSRLDQSLVRIAVIEKEPLPPRLGARTEGHPIRAFWNTVRNPSKWNEHFHEAIPPDSGEPASVWTSAKEGGILGAMLGLVAGIAAGLLAVAISAIQRMPLAMMPLGEDKGLWGDFGFVALITGLTILDTGAKQPETGQWSTPLFWWVAGLTVIAFLGSNTLREASNRRRQQAILG